MMVRRTAIQSLTEAIMSFQLDTIPDDVLSLAKRCLVDVCGVTLAGSKTLLSWLLFTKLSATTTPTIVTAQSIICKILFILKLCFFFIFSF